jgi:hypothetical protein
MSLFYRILIQTAREQQNAKLTRRRKRSDRSEARAKGAKL